MFDKMKALLDMQKKIQEIKRQLDATDFEIKSQDGRVTVVMNGSQQVQNVIIAEGRACRDRSRTPLTAR